MRTLQTPTQIATELVTEQEGRIRFGMWGIGPAEPEPDPSSDAAFTNPTLRTRLIGGAIRAIERDRSQAREVDDASCYAAYLKTFAGKSVDTGEPDVRAAIALGVLDRNGGKLSEERGLDPFEQPPSAPRLRSQEEVVKVVAQLLGEAGSRRE